MADPVQQVLLIPSAAQTVSGNSGSVSCPQVDRLAVDVSVTAVSGTSPTLTLFLERQGLDGIWYAIWSPTAITAAGVASTSVGHGLATAQSITGTIRLRWVIGGTTPSFTFSASITGR